MKKFPKPWYRPNRGVWYVTLDGHQHNLGPNEDEAFERYKQLLAAPKATPVPSDSLASIIDAFLEWVSRNRAPDTYRWYQYRLQRFLRKHPAMRAADVRPFHVEAWVDSYTLSVTSRRNYLRTVKRCLSWATKRGYLDKNPVADLEVPAAERKEVHLSAEDIQLLLSSIKDRSLLDLVTVTIETGCRPQESLRVEARHVDLANQRWIFSKQESKNKKMSRVVYLTDTANDIIKRLVKSHPNGKLFRNINGKPWTTAAVNCAFCRIQIRLGMMIVKAKGLEVGEDRINLLVPRLSTHRRVKGDLVPKTSRELHAEAKRKLTYKLARELAPKWSLYALRHAWATGALQKGVDPLTVAILMGHSDPSMLSKVYQHLSLHPAHMLTQAKRAVG